MGRMEVSVEVAENIFFFFQAEDGIRDLTVTGVQTCALELGPRGYHRCVGLHQRRRTGAVPERRFVRREAEGGRRPPPDVAGGARPPRAARRGAAARAGGPPPPGGGAPGRPPPPGRRP